MEVAARPALASDLSELIRLYRELEEEMLSLHAMWNQADGLPEPLEESLTSALGDTDTLIYLGEIDGSAVGFILARAEALLPQANPGRVGSIRLVFVESEAREVGVGEAMREAVLTELGNRGITKFDAHVLPGHRLAKNFFEAGGFSARSIVMHRAGEKSR